MAVSRYARTQTLELGRRFGTSRAVEVIRRGIDSGAVRYTEETLQGGERLDTVAGRVYGTGEYWWAIAAASGIGWGAQVPPGTYLRIPVIDDVLRLVG